MSETLERLEKISPNIISGAAGGASITSLLTSSAFIIGVGALVSVLIIVITLLYQK